MKNITRRSAIQGGVGAFVVGALSTGAANSASATSQPTIKIGSKGAAVKTLQSKLNASGFWLGSGDGTFGALTQQAVYALQKFHGLARDGVVGPKTWSAVNSMKRPTPRSSASGIEIDKRRQLLMVVSGGKVAITLNTSTASGQRFWFRNHMTTAVTPSGSFKVWTNWGSSWQNGALGKMWRPYYFNGDIAIHGSPSIPPYPASHGCCRLSVSAQNYLISKGYLKRGTSVRVY